MTTPTLPRKHLYTIPHGSVLPDATTVEDGWPFLLETGSGGSLTRTLYQNQAGTWKVVAAGGGSGGGGGTALFGDLLPVPAGKDGTNPDYWTHPDAHNAGATSNVSSYRAIVPFDDSQGGLDPAGNPITHAWQMSTSAADDGHTALRVTVPYTNPVGDDNGQRAMRMDFKFKAQGGSTNGLVVVAVTDSYPNDYVYRNQPNPSAVLQHLSEVGQDPNGTADAYANYNGGVSTFPENYAPIWGSVRGSGWTSHSITIPPGSYNVYFQSYASGGWSDTPPAITDIRFTELDQDFPDGTTFLELPSHAQWIMDKSLRFTNKTQADAYAANPTDPSTHNNHGGSGWYRVTRPVIIDRYGNEIDPAGVNNPLIFHTGLHYFTDLKNQTGASYGLAPFARIPVGFSGVVPDVNSATAFDDFFLRPDGRVTQSDADSFLGSSGSPYSIPNPTPLSVPAAPDLSTVFSGGAGAGSTVFDGTTGFYYAQSSTQHVSGVEKETPISDASGPFVPVVGGGVLIPTTPAPGADGVKLYRSTSATGPWDHIHTSTVTSPDGYVSYPVYGPAYLDGGAVKVDNATPVGADSGTIDVAISETGLRWSQPVSDSSVRSLVLVNTTNVQDREMLVQFDPLLPSGNDKYEVWFRAADEQNGMFIQLYKNNSWDPLAWQVVNRVAGVDTVLKSGTLDGVMPERVRVKVDSTTHDGSGNPNKLKYGIKIESDQGSGGPGQVYLLTDDQYSGDLAGSNLVDMPTDHETDGIYWGVRGGLAPVRRWRFEGAYGSALATNLPLTRTVVPLDYKPAGNKSALIPPGMATSGGRIVATEIALSRKAGTNIEVLLVRKISATRRVLHKGGTAYYSSSTTGTVAGALSSTPGPTDLSDSDLLYAYAVVPGGSGNHEATPVNIAATFSYGG